MFSKESGGFKSVLWCFMEVQADYRVVPIGHHEVNEPFDGISEQFQMA